MNNRSFIIVSLCLSACKDMPEPGSAAFIKAVIEAVDDQVLVNADQRQGDWLSYGKNYSEDRYITLDQINRDNIDQLGLAWSLNLETRRGLETTSIVVDGIMYVTGNYTWYTQYCQHCYRRVAIETGGSMPDLAYMNESIYQSFEDIVLQGVLSSNGMPSFQGELTSGQVLNIRSYILVQAKKKGQSSGGKAVQ